MNLVWYRRPIYELRAEINQLGREPEAGSMVEFRIGHALLALFKFLRDTITPKELEDWALLIEGREDIVYTKGFEEELKAMIAALANPKSRPPISAEYAANWVNRLTAKTWNVSKAPGKKRFCAKVNDPQLAKPKHDDVRTSEMDGSEIRVPIPVPDFFLIEEAKQGVFLYGYLKDGRCSINDLQLSTDAAKRQASFEADERLSPWKEVPDSHGIMDIVELAFAPNS